MHETNSDAPLDLNLLRLFDALYRMRSVSRAAEALGLSQPAASQGLTRLRLRLHDALFVRAGGAMQPTPRAERLAGDVQQGLRLLEGALAGQRSFAPTEAALTLRLHLSDIGEARFLPDLLAALHREAPRMRVHSRPLPHEQITAALDTGQIDFAIGYLPGVQDTRRTELLRDRYAVLLRAGHPLLAGPGAAPRLADLKRLEVVAVRSHAETLRIVQLLGLTQRLVSAHFLALPAIVRATDLGVVMPRAIAQGFAESGDFAIVDTGLPRSSFTVSLHWSARFEADPAHQWLRQLLLRLFQGHGARARPGRSTGSSRP